MTYIPGVGPEEKSQRLYVRLCQQLTLDFIVLDQRLGGQLFRLQFFTVVNHLGFVRLNLHLHLQLQLHY